MAPENNAPHNFQCNICNANNIVPPEKLTREEPTCTCGSTVRMRSIIHALTMELFGKSLNISDIDPPRPDIVGIGMSCWDGYAIPLAHRVAYKNTYYHQEPFLDITNIDPAMEGSLDFIISTDVYEHVAPPVSIAFENTLRLLKPNGVFIFTVPYFHTGEKRVQTTEHFPDLHNYDLQESENGYRLVNTTRKGETQIYEDLVFHGGPGTTLEMRVFSEWSVLRELKRAGFNDLTIYGAPEPKHGILWPLKHSMPIAARVKRDKKFWQFGAQIKHR